MTREFVELSLFTKRWKKLGLDDRDLKLLQTFLSTNPQIGDVIKDTGGIRKVRFSTENKGKSGGGRVIYVDFAVHKKTYLISVYAKNEKEDITEDEKKTMKQLVEFIEKELDKNE